MSPLGPLSVFPLLQPRLPIIDPNYFSHNSGVVTNEGFPYSDQLLRFMSVSLVNKESSAPNLHHHHQQHQQYQRSNGDLLGVHHRHLPLLTSGKSRNRMTLKLDQGQGNNNQVKNGGTKTLLHGIRNFINPEPSTTAGKKDDTGEDVEVLSIGGGDEGEEVAKGHHPPAGDETDDVEIDVDDSMSTVTTTTGSHSPSPSSSTSVRSPTPENNSIDPTNFRYRNYSSEDSLSMKPPPYNPLNSLSEAFINGTAFQQRQEEQRQHQASLFFSIANILRPDFGLGRLPGLLPSSIPPPPPPIGFLNHFNNNKQPHHHHHNRPPTKRTKSGGFLRDDLPQVKKSKLGKHEPVIPIDLSRPTATPPEWPPRKSSNSSNHTTTSTGHKSAKHNRTNNKTPPWSSSSSSSFPLPLHPQERKSPDGKNGNGPTPPGPAPPPERTKSSSCDDTKEKNWPPAWVFCTRYSDRPSSGPRTRRSRKQKEKEVDEKRPRTAFTADQLSRLKKEFDDSQYLTEKRRQDLANDLQLHENQIKIWFQNKRAKLKKSTGKRGPLAQKLEAQGLYNHSTIPPRGHEDEDSEMDDE